jgi:hypothetical protein
MGRLSDHFNRLPKYATDLISKIRTMEVDQTKVAKRTARQQATTYPGPLQTPDDPPNATARQRAARKAVRVLMAAKAGGWTQQRTKAFDRACAVIDGDDYGPIIRSGLDCPTSDRIESAYLARARLPDTLNSTHVFPGVWKRCDGWTDTPARSPRPWTTGPI